MMEWSLRQTGCRGALAKGDLFDSALADRHVCLRNGILFIDARDADENFLGYQPYFHDRE